MPLEAAPPLHWDDLDSVGGLRQPASISKGDITNLENKIKVLEREIGTIKDKH